MEMLYLVLSESLEDPPFSLSLKMAAGDILISASQ